MSTQPKVFRIRRCCPWPLVIAGLLLSGCGGNALGRLPISGKVTLQGKPLERGNIDIRPAAGVNGVGAGANIEQGAYAIAEERGLPPGEYEVRVHSSKEDPRPAPPGGGSRPAIEQIPAKYNSRTELKIEVKADGENVFNFDL